MAYKAKMARMVLGDCRYALTELRNDPQGSAWRIRWFGMLAMLKSVHYVLLKLDPTCPEMKEAVDDWRNNLKTTKPDIFCQFITRDRDAIVHEYEYHAGQNVTVRPGTGHYDFRSEQEVTVTPGGPTTYTYPIHGGPFDGQDQRDVVQKAIEWWEQQLTDIERDAGRRAVGPRPQPSPTS